VTCYRLRFTLDAGAGYLEWPEQPKEGFTTMTEALMYALEHHVPNGYLPTPVEFTP